MPYLQHNYRQEFTTPVAKAKEQRKIDKQIEKYLKAGGKITKLKTRW